MSASFSFRSISNETRLSLVDEVDLSDLSALLRSADFGIVVGVRVGELKDEKD